jgi:predicted CoA-binding protein
VTIGNVSPVEVLKRAKTIAVVGASKSPEKPAHSVPLYLKEQGYTIVPVNPTATEIFGEKAYRSILEVPENVAKTIDVVEVFRPSEELPEVASQTVELAKRYGRPMFFWAQQGIQNDEAERILQKNGIQYVMDACMRTVHQLQVRRAA